MIKILYFTGFIFILLLFMYLCHRPAIEEHIIENIYLYAPDTDDQVTISIKIEDSGYIGIISPTTVAYGYTDKYLFIKQIPYNSLGDENYESIASYYVLTLKKELNEYNFVDYLEGPLQKKEFELLCKNIGVNFDKILKYRFGSDY